MPRQRRLQLIGCKFNYLEVIAKADAPKAGKTMWVARCVCGSEKIYVGSELTQGRAQSCGCKRNELISSARTRHGKSQHPMYGVWRSMKARCRNPKHKAFARYGGRGIDFCSRWESFDNFWVDMSDSYAPGLTLDRIENNAGYSPENCKWVSRTAQARNTRSNRVISTPWGDMLLIEASERSGILPHTLAWRIDNGWPQEHWFIKPDVANNIMGMK